MAVVIAILVFLSGLLCLELGYRLFLLGLFWLAPFWCAIAAAYFVISLHLSDPLAPLWAFMAAAFCGRLLMGRVRNWLLVTSKATCSRLSGFAVSYSALRRLKLSQSASTALGDPPSNSAAPERR